MAIYQQLTAGGVWHKHHQSGWCILHWRAIDLSILPLQRTRWIVYVQVHGET